MGELEIVCDENGNKVVVVPEIIFKNRQSINWSDVEKYLENYVGRIVEITESKDVIYLGKKLPNEYVGSKYTAKLKGSRAKAKANAVQGLCEMVGIATNKRFKENQKQKHSSVAGEGWYYYTTRFAVPIYKNELFANCYSVYTGCLVVNCTVSGRKYLYDLVDIKKEASTPLKN